MSLNRQRTGEIERTDKPYASVKDYDQSGYISARLVELMWICLIDEDTREMMKG